MDSNQTSSMPGDQQTTVNPGMSTTLKQPARRVQDTIEHPPGYVNNRPTMKPLNVLDYAVFDGQLVPSDLHSISFHQQEHVKPVPSGILQAMFGWKFSTKPSLSTGCQCSCPNDARFRKVTGDSGSRLFAFNVSHCTYACHASPPGDDQGDFLTFWLGLWASLCFASTLLTVCTFLIDRDRFQVNCKFSYPNKNA